MPLELIDIPGNRYWLSDDEVRDLWTDAPDDEDHLAMLNAAAIAQLVAFAPARMFEPVESSGYMYFPALPDTYRIAQLAQIRNIYNAGRVNPSGDFGSGEFVITPFPLTWQVQALIRPRRGVPVVG